MSTRTEQTAATTGTTTGTGRSGVLFAMCFALILVSASVSALNLALPDLSVALGASTTDLTWIADGYTVALAALVLPLGALGDRLGRRTVLLAGTAVFALTSVGAALAGSSGQLIVWRVAMGVGAAMIMPGTLSTITSVYPQEARSRAVSVWSACAAAGAILGMLVAGALLERWGWESIFWASAVTAVVAGLFAVALTPAGQDDRRQGRLDLVGAVSLAVAIGALVYAIIDGNDAGWTEPAVLGAVAACLAGLVVYVAAGLRHENPLLDPRVFLLRGPASGGLAVVAQFMAVFGFFFVGLQYLQLILGYSPFHAALALSPVVLAIVPVSQLTPQLVRRVGPAPVMATGLVLIGAGLAWVATLDVGSGYLPFLGGLVISGAGLGLAGSSATTAIVEALPRDRQGVASAVNDATREVGAAVGIALLGSVYGSHYRDALPAAPSGLSAGALASLRDSAAAGLQVARQSGAQAGTIAADVRAAFIQGLSASLVVVTVILAVCAVLILIRGPYRNR